MTPSPKRIASTWAPATIKRSRVSHFGLSKNALKHSFPPLKPWPASTLTIAVDLLCRSSSVTPFAHCIGRIHDENQLSCALFLASLAPLPSVKWKTKRPSTQKAMSSFRIMSRFCSETRLPTNPYTIPRTCWTSSRPLPDCQVSRPTTNRSSGRSRLLMLPIPTRC